jgi:hypothetical protein
MTDGTKTCVDCEHCMTSGRDCDLFGWCCLRQHVVRCKEDALRCSGYSDFRAESEDAS